MLLFSIWTCLWRFGPLKYDLEHWSMRPLLATAAVVLESGPTFRIYFFKGSQEWWIWNRSLSNTSKSPNPQCEHFNRSPLQCHCLLSPVLDCQAAVGAQIHDWVFVLIAVCLKTHSLSENAALQGLFAQGQRSDLRCSSQTDPVKPHRPARFSHAIFSFY